MAWAGPSPRAQPRAEKAGFLFLVGADAWRERTDRTLTGLNQVSTSSVVEGKELPPRSASESARVSSPDDGGDDAPGVLAVHYVLEESSGYMEPTLRILAVLHTVISFFCIIGYYCLKVSRAGTGAALGEAGSGMEMPCTELIRNVPEIHTCGRWEGAGAAEGNMDGADARGRHSLTLQRWLRPVVLAGPGGLAIGLHTDQAWLQAALGRGEGWPGVV